MKKRSVSGKKLSRKLGAIATAVAGDPDVAPLPFGDFKFWFGQYVISSLALKFFHKHKKFPVAFSKKSVLVSGRNISMEMK